MMVHKTLDSRKPTSNRFKGLFVSYGYMMRIICGEATITNIPDWTRLVECQHDFMRRGFMLIVEHPSFPRVPLGSECEYICAKFEETKPHGPRKLTFK